MLPKEKDRRYTMGDSLGGEVLGHALGWAAARLSGVLENVLKADMPRTGSNEGSMNLKQKDGKMSEDE